MIQPTRLRWIGVKYLCESKRYLSTVNGSTVLSRALKRQGVEYMFGIVGIPVFELAEAAQKVGIKYIGMRNEQSAAYAASAFGYLTKRPAVCLTVSGPGFVNALSGMANATENNWPMIVVGGSSDVDHKNKGAFQEFPQVSAASNRCYAKYSACPHSITNIPFQVEKAYRHSIYGKPGVSYLDIPANLIKATSEENQINYPDACQVQPRLHPDPISVKRTIDLLKSARKPLIIIGKGAAYARAESSIRDLIELSRVPFLPMPMGKGVVPDNHELCISPARSMALKEADVVVLLGARLNWQLHFGLPPRFDSGVKIVQVDICPEQIHENVRAEVGVVADIDVFVEQVNSGIRETKSRFLNDSWTGSLKDKIAHNRKMVDTMSSDHTTPLNFYAAFTVISEILPVNCYVVAEGANSMDIGRSMLLNQEPRLRLDAGTFGTMGVGPGYAIAAALHEMSSGTNRRVVCFEGDSAFGFAGLEFETMARYKLPIITIIMNNSGIYAGVERETDKDCENQDLPLRIPPTALYSKAQYHHVAEIAGGLAMEARSVEELQGAVKKALSTDRPSIINCLVAPSSTRKPQEHGWMSKHKS